MATAFASVARPSARPRRYKLTVDQLSAMIDTGVIADDRVELIEGELIEMPSEYVPHMWAKTQIQQRLYEALKSAGSPLIASVEGGFRASPISLPVPDIIVWERVRVDGFLPSAQVRLAVEVCATSHFMDFRRKPRLYASAGVPEYWIADLVAHTVTVMSAPIDDAYTRTETIPFGSPVRSPTLAIEIATGDLG